MWDFRLKSFLHDLKNHKEKPPVRRRMCDIAGCEHTGEYRAPKSRDTMNEYFWFCLDHVREYNSQWDYFKGMSAVEIQNRMHNTATWDRPTWRMTQAGMNEDRVREKIYAHFREEGIAGNFSMGDDAENPHIRVNLSTIPQPVAEAMAILDISPPVEWDHVRAQYKNLTKKYHPDANVGNAEAEEKFKKITLAYNILKLTYKDYQQLDER